MVLKSWRRILLGLLVFIVAWEVVAWVAARALVVDADLSSADAIVVLSGSSAYVERTHKAAELYRAGRAPLIWLTDDHMRGGWSSALQRNPYFVERATDELIKAGVIASAHDISEGGLVVTLLESCFNRNLGVEVTAAKADIRKDAYWFGEAQSRVVVSVKADKVDAFKKVVGNHPYEKLGQVTSGAIKVDGKDWGTIEAWKNKYDTAIENLLAGHESEHALSAL